MRALREQLGRAYVLQGMFLMSSDRVLMKPLCH